MISITVTSRDLKERIDLMKRYPEMINANIVDVFKAVLLDIERISKKNAPVDTGRLRADIATKLYQKELKGVVYNTVEYAIYVHEGTRKMRARPYILNAIRGEEPKIVRELQRNALKEKRGLI